MLIQALFKLVGRQEFHLRQSFGLRITDLPEPKGNFDHKTIQAIWAFQHRMAHRLLNVDGKIHPGNYKNRVINTNNRERLMTITLLNLMAVDEALMTYSLDVISALKQVAPQLILTRVDP